MKTTLILLTILLLSSAALAQVAWEHPNGISGGSVGLIAAGPNDRLYVMGLEGRLYRSTDDGETWLETFNPQSEPLFGERMWLNVTANGMVLARYRDFVVRSDDEGGTWTTIPGAPNLLATGQDPQGRIYATSDLATDGIPCKLFISEDDGMTWQEIENFQMPSIYDPYSLTVDASGTIYIISPSDDDVIWRSSDNGKSWDNAVRPPWWGVSPSLDKYSIKALSDGSVISLGNHTGFARSTDRGSTWELFPVENFPSKSDMQYVQYDVDPNGNIMFIQISEFGQGSERVFRIKDGKCIDVSPAGAIGTVQRIYSGSNNTFYLGTDGAMYKTTDFGENWVEIMLPNFSVFGLARTTEGSIIATSSFFYYVHAQPSRNPRHGWGSVMRSTNNGASWKHVNTQFDRANLFLRQVVRGPVGSMMMTADGPLYISVDDGLTWNKKSASIGDDPYNYFPVYLLALGKEDKIFATKGISGLFMSSDEGTTWEPAVSTGPFAVYALAIDSNSVVYTGGYQRDTIVGQDVPSSWFLRSEDNGNTWTQLPLIVEGEGIRSLAARNNTDIFAAIDRIGVFRSQDKGVTWTLIDEGLPMVDYSSLHVNDAGKVLLATTDGVFLLEEDEAKWTNISGNLYNKDVLVLATATDGRLIAGTESGVTRTTEAIPFASASNKDLPVFDQKVRIALSNDVIGGGFAVGLDVRDELIGHLEVLDLAGRILIRTPDRPFLVGRHQVHVGRGLSNGSYYVRFVSGQTIAQGCIGNLW